jgi:hypothetical protein
MGGGLCEVVRKKVFSRAFQLKLFGMQTTSAPCWNGISTVSLVAIDFGFFFATNERTKTEIQLCHDHHHYCCLLYLESI